MEINNEIRRLKTKLKLFEEEGFNWVLHDIIEVTTDSIDCLPLNQAEKTRIIKGLKEYYLKQLEALLPPNNKQGKLEL